METGRVGAAGGPVPIHVVVEQREEQEPVPTRRLCMVATNVLEATLVVQLATLITVQVSKYFFLTFCMIIVHSVVMSMPFL